MTFARYALTTVTLLLILVSGSGTGVALAAGPLVGDSLKGRIVGADSRPVKGATVQLLGPSGTMMDTTTTGADGKFSIDLGVLEDNELKQLKKFKVAVSKGGRKASQGLDSKASSSDGVVVVEDIPLP